MSIMQAGDWARASVPARCYFSTYITTTDQHQDSVQHAVLGFSVDLYRVLCMLGCQAIALPNTEQIIP